MFKIFKNERNEHIVQEVIVDDNDNVVSAPRTVAPAASVQPTAEEIQRELLGRNDEILRSAKELLEDRPKSSEEIRAERLRSLGFILTKEGKAAREKSFDVVSANEKISNEQACAQQYPGMKFISEDAMSEVCKKYGLVVGGIGRYKGHVPDWVLDRIEQLGVPTVAYPLRERNSFSDRWSGGFGMRDKIDFKDPANRRIREEDMAFNERMTSDPRVQNANFGDDSGWSHMTFSKEAFDEYHIPTGWWDRTEPCSVLRIAAPVAEMEVRRDEQVREGRIVRVASLDPIVCFKVKGGYAVVCAWGEEGTDPRVFNAESN